MNEEKILELIKGIIGKDYIGDDVAFIKEGDKYLLVTVDCAVEGRHFLYRWDTYLVGWKIVSANVSDITAKGGKPKYLLVSLGLRKSEEDFIKNLYRGMADACNYYGCIIVGGNLSYSPNTFIDVFLLGEAKRKVERGTGNVDEGVFLYGNLGVSRAGLEVMLGKHKIINEELKNKLIMYHFKPETAFNIADHILNNASSSIDISDGLIIDLYRMVKAGNYGIELFKEALYKIIKPELFEYCKYLGTNPIDYVLYGGEDYAVVFTQDMKLPAPEGASLIGRIIEKEGVYLEGKPLPIKGFDHFSGLVP